MNLKKLSNIDELEVGSYYWCVPRNKVYEMSIEIVGEIHKTKYVGYGRIWASPGNNQAFRRWDIYGPIPKVTIK